jgi:hypothetical protein
VKRQRIRIDHTDVGTLSDFDDAAIGQPHHAGGMRHHLADRVMAAVDVVADSRRVPRAQQIGRGV